MYDTSEVLSEKYHSPQNILGAIQMMKFESFKRFLNVSFWHNFVILVKIAVLR